MSKAILYYVHDPMCSWCWGFSATWEAIQQGLPANIKIERVMGGLAADTDQPMPQEQQQNIKANWQRIQQHIPGVEFNYDFWDQCQPRRSTYPACRAVLAASKQDAALENDMILAIQHAYYLHAKNPSDDAVLIDLAAGLGLDVERFSADLNSAETCQQLQKNIQCYQQLATTTGIRGFPSMVLKINDSCVAVPLNYTEAPIALDFIRQHSAAVVN